MQFSKWLSFVVVTLVVSHSHAVSYSLSSFKNHFQTGKTCWASVTKMILSHQGREEKICNILSRATNEDCCKFGGIFVAKSCYDRNKMLPILGIYGMNYELVIAPPSHQPQVFSRIVNAIRQNKMPVFRYQNAADLRYQHVAVIKAVHNVESPTNMVFDIVDPALGTYSLSARDLAKKFTRLDGYTYYLVSVYLPL